MFCPQCEQEYPWDVMVCPACDVDTVDELGPAEFWVREEDAENARALLQDLIASPGDTPS